MYIIGVILGILAIAVPVVLSLLILTAFIKFAIAMFGAGFVIAITVIVVVGLLLLALIGANLDS
ncbi:hypothetical protein HED42_08825 [Enterococcus casseliflavus]|uniref:hypothetical protein n=1 Tax=Enterococcus casseliflavus TaxID=37734 RepID=UPI001433458E|nr:hypothetical protein [Enterococcus casseliflavus]NKD38235.1 hypothetical protein [Enterococcus casseliflavus]